MIAATLIIDDYVDPMQQSNHNVLNRKPEVECRERFIWKPSATRVDTSGYCRDARIWRLRRRDATKYSHGLNRKPEVESGAIF